MADNPNQTIDPWIAFAARKIGEKYLRSNPDMSSCDLRRGLMDKIDDALFWIDVGDGPDGFIVLDKFRQTLQKKLNEYATKKGGADTGRLQAGIGLLLERLETMPTENGRIDRERLEGAIALALRDTLKDSQVVSEIRQVSGEMLGSLRATNLIDRVVEQYRAPAAQNAGCR